MTWSAIVTAVRERFEAEVATPAELVTVYGNQPPHRIEEAGAAGWARVSIVGGGHALAATGVAGSRRYRTTGVIVVNLFAPLDEGDSGQDGLVDDVIAAFRGVRLELDGPTYLHFQPPIPYGDATPDEDRWWRRDVRIPFHADDFGGSEP